MFPVALVRFSLGPRHWAAGPLLLQVRVLPYTGPIGHQGTAGRFYKGCEHVHKQCHLQGRPLGGSVDVPLGDVLVSVG